MSQLITPSFVPVIVDQLCLPWNKFQQYKTASFDLFSQKVGIEYYLEFSTSCVETRSPQPGGLGYSLSIGVHIRISLGHPDIHMIQ